MLAKVSRDFGKGAVMASDYWAWGGGFVLAYAYHLFREELLDE